MPVNRKERPWCRITSLDGSMGDLRTDCLTKPPDLALVCVVGPNHLGFGKRPVSEQGDIRVDNLIPLKRSKQTFMFLQMATGTDAIYNRPPRQENPGRILTENNVPTMTQIILNAKRLMVAPLRAFLVIDLGIFL